MCNCCCFFSFKCIILLINVFVIISGELQIMKIPVSERAFLGSNSKLVIGPRRSRNPFLRRKVPPVPSAAHWGFGYLPPCAKILILGVLCGLISITTPFWASVKADIFGQATYGLWHFCRGEDCTSIHDNIIEGSSVPGCFSVLNNAELVANITFTDVGLTFIPQFIFNAFNLFIVKSRFFAACL